MHEGFLSWLPETSPNGDDQKADGHYGWKIGRSEQDRNDLKGPDDRDDRRGVADQPPRCKRPSGFGLAYLVPA
jgi:hypothetical protein